MCCTFCLAVSIFHSRKINDKTNIKPSLAFSAQLQGMGSRQTAGGKEGFWILHFILLGVSELFWWCWQEVGKKALWQQLCPLSTHFSHAHVHSQHPLPHNLASKGSQRQAYTGASAFCDVWLLRRGAEKPGGFLPFNQSMKVGKGRGGTKNVKIPQVFCSPALGITVRGFHMNEWHTFQAALELHVCGDNVATPCCSENDGQYPPAAGPREISAPSWHFIPATGAGNGELGILRFILPAVTKFLCEPWVI